MMNFEELFIGDYLRIMSKGVLGRFHGMDGDRILVKVGEKTLRAKKDDLEFVPDEEAEKMQSFQSAISKGKQSIGPAEKAEFTDELDLHLSALEDAGYVRFNYETILEFQLRICERFIRQAKSLGVARIRIIHGKGQGILKAEVAHLLDMSRSITDFEPDFSGGGFIAWLGSAY